MPGRAETFVRTFRRLVKRDVLPGVLHPAVRVPSQTDLERAAERWREHFEPDLAKFLEGGPVFLSVNRFERKKVRAAVCAAALLGCSASLWALHAWRWQMPPLFRFLVHVRDVVRSHGGVWLKGPCKR